MVRVRFSVALCVMLAACGHGTQHVGPDAGGELEEDGGGVSANDAGATRRDAGTPRRDAGSGKPPGGGTAPAGGTFPLKISRSGRYLEDASGRPFLINQAASWGLVQSLSLADATTYLDGLAARGFNTVMVSIISNDARMPGDPPAWQGIDPFTARWDFSTANPRYFAHADEIFRLARDRGMLVNVVAVYLGFSSDPTQGWADELLGDDNDAAKSMLYGRFLGQRYKSFDNLVWVAGGDNLPSHGSELERRLKAVIDGIRAEDPEHLWTAHWSGLDDGTYSTENPTFASYMDLNGYYAFNYATTYTKDLSVYGQPQKLPQFHLDMSYETEGGGEPESIRRRAYTAILSGAMGSSFNAGPNWYLFRNWRNMDTQGTQETEYWYRFFASRPWQDLVPDDDHSAVTAGYGSFGSTSYVCVAHTSDWKLVVAYLPRGGTLTVQLERVQGEQARAYWYDPTSGKARDAGTFAASGSRDFSAPSQSSWVLVVEDASAQWEPPGSLPN
jgi:hypothetical protein